MKHPSIVALGAALSLVAPGLAFAAACQAPTAPTAVDGSTATLQQMLAAKSGVTDFITASDAYQDCVVQEFQAQKAAADAAKAKVDPALAKAADAKVSASQADKERVGSAFNAAAKAYRAAHPS
jgi:hypothetical protein